MVVAGEARRSVADRWAWGVCWLMFASTVLNYVDRQAIALVRPQIMAEFRINFETFGWVMAAFQLTYALFQVPAGYLADRLDVRALYGQAVVWWSLAAVGTAFSPTLGVLIALRALLGVGESFNWPCALRVTERILSPAERGLGNGIFNSGAAVGAVLTPLLIPVLAEWLGWRVAFVVVGSLGLCWVVAWWWWVVRSPRALVLAGRSESGPERVGREGSGRDLMLVAGLAVLSVALGAWGYKEHGPTAIWMGVTLFMLGLLGLARMIPLEQAGTSGWMESLARVVRLRRFWVLVIVSVCINICWHFLVGWLPTFLKEDRQLPYVVDRVKALLDTRGIKADASYLVSSVATALIFVAADLGNLVGGMASRRLAEQGIRPAAARWQVMIVCAIAISVGVSVGYVRNSALTIGILSVMAMGAAALMANYFAFCQEVDRSHTGLIVGILGGLGNLFAAGILPVAGMVKDRTGQFGPVFMVVGLSPMVGVVLLGLWWGRDGVVDQRVREA
jgi:ACS family hexuronate transporter-like MFS transporter